MIYPRTYEDKIGFSSIRELVKSACYGTCGQGYADKMHFSASFDIVTRLLGQTSEFIALIQSGATFPSQNYFDLDYPLNKAEIENSWLDESEFHNLKLALLTAQQCVRFLTNEKNESYALLRQLCLMVIIDKNLLPRLEAVINEKGKVRDSASTELQRIRRTLIAEQTTLRKRIETILRFARSNDYVPENQELTVRNGRIVIPILAEHKRKIKGFIHDESATGQTVYLEPTEIFEANNLIRELQIEEQREIIKILTQLTEALRPNVPALRKVNHFLGLIDFIRAKARVALDTRSVSPLVLKHQAFNWVNARHPLLEKSLQKQQKQISPLSISLTVEDRILLISGPNAGGKSVCLKTVGLLQYMLQCGMPIPIDPDSETGIFDDIFLDMGDDQSIENDLSTYSSHLGNMRHFVRAGTKKTLVLIDEFGTGTDPQYGGGIAQAILQHLNNDKVYGVITTHYGNLKAFADVTEGITNACMRYDVANMQPLYALEIGKPGSSFALEIAEKMGLPKAILHQARQNIGFKQVKLDKMLGDLEAERNKYQQLSTEAAITSAKLNKTLEDYTQLKQLLDTNKAAALLQAKQQAKALVKEANQKIESTIRGIKEANADKETTKTLRADLEKFTTQALKFTTEETKIVAPVFSNSNASEDSNTKAMPLRVGGYVRVLDSGAVATIISLNNTDAELHIGQLSSHVKLRRLQPITTAEYNQASGQQKIEALVKGLDISNKVANFTYTLDVRGSRADDALTDVTAYIDDAILIGARQVRILHGKGDGILKTLIRKELKKLKQITTITDDILEMGGSGISVVTLAN